MTHNDGNAPESIRNKVLEIGSRLKAAPSELMVNAAFADELKNEARLFAAIGLVDITHTLVAIEINTIPKAEGRKLLIQLLALQSKPESFVMTAAKGDIYTNREAWLAERTDAVAWLGAGRARREAVTTAFILVTRQQIVEFIGNLTGLVTTLTRQAEQHLYSVMPDYTYWQAAQPTTFGHYLLGFAYPLLRDLERLDSLLARLNLSPMGCGSTNGSRLRQDRGRLAELLGFDGLIAHARDAMWQADVFLETSSILTACSISVSRLAEDLQIFGSQEFALVELDDRHSRASKIMPQKKNPFALTHIRSVANRLIGLTASVAASVRTPTGQPDNRTLVYGELPDAIQSVGQATALMTEVLETMTFNKNRAETLVSSGWAMATDLAESLMLNCGIDFRSAHRLVAHLAGEYRDKGLPELDNRILMTSAEKLFGCAITLTEQQFKSALDLNAAIQARTQPGGTAVASMNKMIAECHQQLIRFRERNLSRKNRFSDKMAALLEIAQNEACRMPETNDGETSV